MWIESLKLKNFLLFKDALIRFDRHFNLVLYPNESGKSSLFKAIVTLLFKSAYSSGKRLSSLKNWDSDSLFALEAVLHFGDESFKVKRDYEAHDQAVYSLNDEAPIAERRKVDRLFDEKLLISDEALFMRLCGVRHEELDLVKSGSRSIGEEVEGILTGGSGVSCGKVLKSLAGYRNSLARGLEKPANEENWGPVKRLAEEIKDLEERLAKGEEIEKERIKLSQTLSEMRSEAIALREELEVKKKALERAEELSNLEEEEKRKIAEAERLRKRFEKARRLNEEAAALERRRNEIPVALRTLSEGEIIRLKVNIERELDLKEKTEKAETKRRKETLSWSLPAALAALFGLIAAGSFFGQVGRGKLHIVFVSVAAILFVIAVVWLWRTISRRASSPDIGTEELKRLSLERKAWSGDVRVSKAREFLERAHALAREKEAVDIKIGELLEGEKSDLGSLLKDLDSEFGRVSVELRGLKERIKELERYRVKAEELTRIEGDVTSLSERVEEVEKAISELSHRLYALETEDTAELNERITDAKKRLERYEARMKAVDIAMETLEKARRMVSGDIAGRLPPLTGAYLAKITSNKYDTLSIDAVTLDMEVVSSSVTRNGENDSSPRRISIEELSKGTRDQVYLAVRLALVELLSSADPVPIILDDPFVHFDDERRWEAFELLMEFAKKHQVIFLSCETDRRFPDGVYRVDLPAAQG